MAADLAALPTLKEEMALLDDAVRAAGEVALAHFGGDIEVWHKDDGSPVSAGDIAADTALFRALSAARPDYGWLSEETGLRPGAATRTFVVDPIDGTRAFLRGEDAWTVVAAIIEGGRPIAAAVLRPVRGELYRAGVGVGAWRDDKRLSVSTRETVAGANIALPGPVYRDCGLREAGAKRAGSLPSLALRLARVADGRLDAVITKPGPHHWDLAAADLIVHEAGGRLTSLSGATLRYDTATTHHTPSVAAPLRLGEALRRMTEGQCIAWA